MNPIQLLKAYRQYRPEIEQAESAVSDARKGNMTSFWNKVLAVVEPIAWAVGGGAATSLGDYVSASHQPDLAELKTVAITGAATGLAAYFRTKRSYNTPQDPAPK